MWKFLFCASNLALKWKVWPLNGIDHLDIGPSFHLQKMGSIDRAVAIFLRPPRNSWKSGFRLNWPIVKISNWPNENSHSSVICRSINPIFLQMESNTYIYVVQWHIGAKLFILVPNLKHEVKKSRFWGPRIFRFFNFDSPWTGPLTFFDLKSF